MIDAGSGWIGAEVSPSAVNCLRRSLQVLPALLYFSSLRVCRECGVQGLAREVSVGVIFLPRHPCSVCSLFHGHHCQASS